MHELIGLIVLVADIWAILKIVDANESNSTKALWIIIILLLPAIGWVLWFAAGPGKKK